MEYTLISTWWVITAFCLLVSSLYYKEEISIGERKWLRTRIILGSVLWPITALVVIGYLVWFFLLSKEVKEL